MQLLIPTLTTIALLSPLAYQDYRYHKVHTKLVWGIVLASLCLSLYFYGWAYLLGSIPLTALLALYYWWKKPQFIAAVDIFASVISFALLGWYSLIPYFLAIGMWLFSIKVLKRQSVPFLTLLWLSMLIFMGGIYIFL